MANEQMLIDATSLKDEILSWAVCIKKPHLLNREDTMFVIDNAPTVDAVPVVRCKECKHWKLIDSLNPHRECQIFYGLHEYGYLTSADDFCSYGERKEGVE